MKIRILSVAQRELMVIAYYNNERAGLGFELAGEFKNTVLQAAHASTRLGTSGLFA